MIDLNRLRFRKTFSIKSFGNSMWPLLQDGDIVNVQKKNFSNITINDIICLKSGKKVYTHRVVYKSIKHVITKGDNNATIDKRVFQRNYLGTVTSFIRGGQLFHIDSIYLLQSSTYFDEVSSVLGLFRDYSLEHVVLKGLPIHLYLQKKIPRRIYADCDLLIDEKDFYKAERVLKKRGYKKGGGLNAGASDEVEISYYKQINGVMVIFDLHRQLSFLATNVGDVGILYPNKKKFELVRKFLDEKREVTVEGERFYILNSENLLIYLLLHLFNHNYVGAYRYELIDILLRKKINYLHVTGIAGQFLIVNFIYPAVLLLDKYYPSNGSKNLVRLINIKKKYRGVISTIVERANIFNEAEEVGVGKHFKLIYKLSTQNELLKPFVFVNKNILQALVKAFSRRVAGSISSRISL